MSARRLIVSADDFGMSAGVNAAIYEAHARGILTEASLMVTGRAAAEAIALARAHPTLGVGLHLVLVQGHAASPPARVPRLVGPDAAFTARPIAAGLRYFFTPGIRAELWREVGAQIEAFLASGLPLSHIDGHVTIHVHPVVLEALLAVSARYGVRAARLPREPLAAALRYDRRHLGRKLFEAAAFAILSRRAVPRMARAGFRHPDRVYGLHQSGHVTEDYVLAVIESLPPGVSELYCHPARVDDEARRWRPADYASEAELAALTSPRVREAITRAGIELISYRDLDGIPTAG